MASGAKRAHTAAFTSLRRATRSTTRTDADADASGPEPKLNLAAFAYAPPAPRKRVKREPEPETKPEVKPEVEEELVSIADVKPDLSVGQLGNGTKAETKAETKREVTKRLAARAKAHPVPPRWREQYELIERMRAGIEAPVDTMGCERPRTMEGLDAKTLRFHILISLMLSSQTKDAVTSQAVLNLHAALPGGLTAESLAAAPESTVADAINKVGFWRRKTGYIQAAARALLEQPGDAKGDVPTTIEGLCALKGVGPKMGFLALQAAWNINAGIGVDVHVHRITNRLRWHKPPTKTPEETRVNLESWLPPPLHRPINPLLVGFGQTICLPVGPRCDVCLLAQEGLCPSRVKVKEGRRDLGYDFGAKVEIGYEEERVGEAEVGEGLVEVKAEADGGLVEVEVEVEDGVRSVKAEGVEPVA